MRIRFVYKILCIGFFCFYNLSYAQESAQVIIDKAIQVAGGSNYVTYNMSFDFRNRHYISKRENGIYEYSRISNKDGEQEIASYGNMKPFELRVNGKLKTIPMKGADNIKNSINSVNYFLLLPFGLNDAAVFKMYKGQTTIKTKVYDIIQVTFSENGGGKDFEDVYFYWINSETSKVDYLAYSYLVNGGGVRFREAYNERYVEGIRFVDYNNYKPKAENIELQILPVLFEKGELDLLSKIETENIKLN